MDLRPIAGALALMMSLVLAACGSSSSGSCSSAEEVNTAGSALTDDLQKAEASGKLDRAKAAEGMSRMLTAGQAYATSHDYRAFCAELAKIRRDYGL